MQCFILRAKNLFCSTQQSGRGEGVCVVSVVVWVCLVVLFVFNQNPIFIRYILFTAFVTKQQDLGEIDLKMICSPRSCQMGFLLGGLTPSSSLSSL